MSALSHKEISLLDYLSSKQEIFSQREMAKKTGLSLGLINAVLHNLIKRGYIKIKNINQKHIQYLLTPKGIAHLTHRSYQAIQNTIHHFLEIENKLNALVSTCLQNGYQHFFLHGNGELSNIVERIILKEFKNRAFIVKASENEQNPVIILNLTNRILKAKTPVINLLSHLQTAREEMLVENNRVTVN